MITYTLQIGIQNTEYASLKERKFKLCIAKASKDGYTVVWRGGDFYPVNHFRWTEEYQALWADKVEEGVPVEFTSFGSNVNFGQTVEIKPNGEMGDATGSLPADPNAPNIAVVNHLDKDVHTVLRCRINGGWKPCYISKSLYSKGDTTTLKPINKVKIWFDEKLVTSTMVVETITSSLEVDFTQGSDSQVVWYGASGSNYGDKGPAEHGTAVWRTIPDMKPDDSQ